MKKKKKTLSPTETDMVPINDVSLKMYPFQRECIYHFNEISKNSLENMFSSQISFILKKGCFFKAQPQKMTCLIVQVREGRNFTNIVREIKNIFFYVTCLTLRVRGSSKSINVCNSKQH